LDVGYIVNRAPMVSAYARPRIRQDKIGQAESDWGVEPTRLEIAIRGLRVTVYGERPISTSWERWRQNAIIHAAGTDARMRALVAGTPRRPPEKPSPDWSYQDGTSTRGAQYARDMSAWHRLYVCRTDAPGRPR
jgi:hypothetical protein